MKLGIIRYKKIIMVLFLSALYFLRAINLDSDLPNWGIDEYTPLDEGYYAMQAIQNVNQDDMNKVQELEGGTYKQWNSSISMFNTAFCTITLKMFGDNYYGLRMGSIFAGFLVFVLILYILMKEQKDKEDTIIVLILTSIMLFNFSFILATRITEPGIFRMLLITISTYCYWRMCNKQNINYYVMGVISILAIIWGYITNLFIFVPLGIDLLLIIYWKRKIPAKKIFQTIAGVCLGYIGGEAVYFLIQKRFYFQDFIRVVLDKEISRTTFSFENAFINIKSFISGNMFSYNTTFLILSVIATIFCLVLGLKNKKSFQIYISLLCIGYFLQSIFTSDFLIRKSIVIFPILLLNIYYLLKDRHKIFNFLKNKNLKTSIIFKAFFLLLCVAAMLISLKRINNIDITDMDNNIKRIMLTVNIISAVLLVIFVYSRKAWDLKGLIIFIAVPLLLPNFFMNYHYIIKMDKTEKQVMIELQELGESYVLGGMPYSYCLYNDIIPVSGYYDAYFPEDYYNRACELVKNEDIRYYLGYRDEEVINNWVKNTKYSWRLIKRFETPYNVYSSDVEQNDVYLFEKVLKQ